MNIQSLSRYSILAGVLVCVLTSLASGQAVDPTKAAAVCSNTITQSFPTTGTAVTTWTICWSGGGNNGANRLAIGPVFFQKSPSSPAIEILYDMRLSEMFVPYHPGQPRYYDISDFNFGLATLTTGTGRGVDCPTNVGGTLLNSYVCEEIRDRGLMWKFPGTSDVRRGEELILWSAIAADNYIYIDKYIFTDDGVIMGIAGATGQNLPGDEEVAHTHQAFWRIDIDLNGTINDAAHLQHIEDITQLTATDTRTPLTVETGFPYVATTADMMEISNPVFKNAQGNLSTYHLMPLISAGGMIQNKEAFTHNDFWVTLYTVGETEARHIPDYIADGGPDSIVDADIVAWMKASLHHHPRDEDGVFNSNNVWTGVTHVMEAGFALMPNDLFDCTPFYHTTCP